MSSPNNRYQAVGVDTGGTFTDFVYMDESGEVFVDKRPSNPSDPAAPVLEGLSGKPKQTWGRLVHGTTVATNALLENKVARTALITTAGFEDVIEIGRQVRPILYASHPRKPPPAIPRGLRFGALERILRDGSIRVPLDMDQVSEILDKIVEARVDAIAVCLLHSYVNPAHEQAIGAAARERGFVVSLSSEVLPEFREYERTSTVAVNASLRPIMDGYLDRLEKGIGGALLSVMQSAGGVIPASIARRLPVQTILSGPAGGVVAAAYMSKFLGADRLITFDMGGTSTDVSLYDRGPLLSGDKIIAGRPIRVPVVDIHTVGAGGGSIAYRDHGGSLKVGPESAGANPGPVCYGAGERVTVTDANLFLGRLDPSYFLGGRMRLYPERLRARMNALADEVGLDTISLAEGIVTVVNAVMDRAIRVISIERGHDPRDFTLVSFGGAGGLHAVELARSLNIPSVTIPRNAGVFSALGMAVADVTRDHSRTILTRASQLSNEELGAILEAMIRAGTQELVSEGVDPGTISSESCLDMRYVGQSHELSIKLGNDPVKAFHRAHEQRYGYCKEETEVEIVNVRARIIASTPKPELKPLRAAGSKASEAAFKEARMIWRGESIAATVVEREKLGPDSRVEGPCIVCESTATTFLPPGAKGHVDYFGAIIVEVGDFSLDSKPE